MEPGISITIPKGSFTVNLLRYIKQGRATKDEIKTNGSSLNCHCDSCNNKVLMSNGKVVESPCKKKYN
jgi:hypothetical protein